MKDEKRIAIIENVFATVEGITSALKDMPRTGKQGRNIFIKTYNRKPGNKRKRAIVVARTALAAAFGAMHALAIVSTPTPKT